ncbi:MAG: DUF4956 domain-containing protein [Caldilineaceae bacterium]|nr:DUF4956 domain-containing protein [Caldilineaceae bacterium]
MTSTLLFTGFLLNLAIALIVVRAIYYPVRQEKNYVFTFLAFNSVIYFVMSFLTNAELTIGVGFGLFAIFSVLRYRTTTMSTREMTYLFIMIALPVMNSVLMRENNWWSLAGANAAMILLLYVLEQEWGFHYESAQLVKYERIELIKPENHALLLADLRERTGLPVKRFEIGVIDFLKDSAELIVYYDEPKAKQRSNPDEVRYSAERAWQASH